MTLSATEAGSDSENEWLLCPVYKITIYYLTKEYEASLLCI